MLAYGTAYDPVSPNRLVFIAVFVIVLIGVGIIPVAIMHGGLGTGWVSVSNAIVYLVGAIIVLGVLARITQWIANIVFPVPEVPVFRKV